MGREARANLVRRMLKAHGLNDPPLNLYDLKQMKEQREFYQRAILEIAGTTPLPTRTPITSTSD